MAPRRDYVGIKLPPELADRVDAFLLDNPWGYRTRGELVATAVREFLQRYGGSPEETGEPLERGKRR